MASIILCLSKVNILFSSGVKLNNRAADYSRFNRSCSIFSARRFRLFVIKVFLVSLLQKETILNHVSFYPVC
jgi:hypothetical protein